MYQILLGLVCINISILSLDVHAENAWFVSLWNQAETKKFCRQVKAEDVRHLANQCYGPQRLDDKNLNLIADDVLRWVIYQEAIKLQVQKDQCLIAQLQLLRNENQGCNLWHQKTIMAWLASRQAQLKTEICERNKEQPEFAKNCLDIAKSDLMKNPDSLFRMSIPLVNNADLLHDIDKNRKDILVKIPAPGHAITNKEILGLDLSREEQLQNLGISCKGEMIRHLNLQLQELEQERKDMLDEIQKTKPINSSKYDLSEDIKDRLYAEGTLHQVLNQEGLLSLNGEAKQKTPAAACVLAYHDENLTAELTEFTGTTAVGFATSAKLLLKSQSFLKMSKLKKLKELASYALLPAGIPLFVDGIKQKCFGINALPGKQVYIDGARISLTEALNLPDNAAFVEVDISSQLEKIPACQGLQIKSWAKSEAGPMTKSDCAFHLLMSALPLHYSIPAMFINNQN
jgi:hypothetical protein